jgi:hypothetical protein
VGAVNVSAVIVTRGDVNIEPVIANVLPHVTDLVIWDNSKRDDMKVYGRYAAIHSTDQPIIYVQDDDCIVHDIPAIIGAHQPETLVCNMPQEFRSHYPDSALVGFGAVFDRHLPWTAFWKYLGAAAFESELSDEFLRTCDVVFSALTPLQLVDVPKTDLPYANGPGRMWKQPDHHGERTRVLNACRALR